MATPVRTLILRNLKAALEAITVVGGYHTTVRAVLRGYQDPESQPKPYIEIITEREPYDEKANPLLERTMAVRLIGFLECPPGAGDGPSEEADKLLADMERATLLDRTRGGNAWDCQLTGSQVFDAEPAAPLVEVHVDVRITFRTQRTNPGTKA